MSINFLRQQVRTLQQQLDSTAPNSLQWHNLAAHLQAVRVQLRQADGGIRGLTF